MAEKNTHTKHEDNLKKKIVVKDEVIVEQKKEIRGLRKIVSDEAVEFKKSFSNKISLLLISAFGLAAALAWNGLIRDIITLYIVPYLGEKSGIKSQLIYAVTVTILAVLVTYLLSRFTTKKKLKRN